ncbi:MAG: 1-acyl-sn-glycerol-3-phosphate acyltransferase [Hyphomicrobiaceae bacterium]
MGKAVSALRLLVFYAFSAALLSAVIVAVIVAVVIRPGKDLYYRVVRYWLSGILRIFGCELVVEGAEHLTKGQDYVFLANHRSLLDPPAIAMAVMPQGTRWVAKQELRRVPIFGKALEMTGQIFIERKDTSRAIQALERHKHDQGAIIVFFPEGHRTEGRSLQPFKNGGAAFAIQAGLPVVPVAVTGTEICLPTRSLQSRPGVIRVRIEVPILTADFHFDQRAELMARVEARVKTMTTEMEGTHPESEYNGNSNV